MREKFLPFALPSVGDGEINSAGFTAPTPTGATPGVKRGRAPQKRLTPTDDHQRRGHLSPRPVLTMGY